MIDQVLGLLEQLMGSPWIYPSLLVMSLVDSVLPLFPSEAPIILSAAYSASTGTPNVFGIFVAAALGAWIGDHVTYFVGRSQAARLERVRPDSRFGRGVSTARRMLARRGGMALVVIRFIPWGRIAMTFVMGATRYPLRSYSMYDALGTCVWALHGCLLGYLGGVAFKDQPLKAMALGLAMAIVAAAAIEGGRWWWARRRSSRPGNQTPVETPPADQATSDSANTLHR